MKRLAKLPADSPTLWQPCPDCGGEMGPIDCDDCGGSGLSAPPELAGDDTELCDLCDGTGLAWYCCDCQERTDREYALESAAMAAFRE